MTASRDEVVFHGAAFRRDRERAGLTRLEVAIATETTERTVASWERDEVESPSYPKLLRARDAINQRLAIEKLVLVDMRDWWRPSGSRRKAVVS